MIIYIELIKYILKEKLKKKLYVLLKEKKIVRFFKGFNILYKVLYVKL